MVQSMALCTLCKRFHVSACGVNNAAESDCAVKSAKIMTDVPVTPADMLAQGWLCRSDIPEHGWSFAAQCPFSNKLRNDRSIDLLL
jgi:hypothetical protein